MNTSIINLDAKAAAFNAMVFKAMVAEVSSKLDLIALTDVHKSFELAMDEKSRNIAEHLDGKEVPVVLVSRSVDDLLNIQLIETKMVTFKVTTTSDSPSPLLRVVTVEGDFEAIGGGMGVLIEPVSPDDDPEFEEFMVQDILLPRTFVESLLK